MAEQPTILPIENCRRWFRFLCPKEWEQLERTDRVDVRHCPGCRKDVYYCDSPEKVAMHRRAGDCVCVVVQGEAEEKFAWLGQLDLDD